MEKERQDKYKYNPNRFICSICLNKHSSKEDMRYTESCKRKSKSCPICQKNNGKAGDKERDAQEVGINGKNVQTSQPDVTQGLNLLNEVLTVFQNKKQSEIKKDKSKTIILKDACVGTERITPKLSVSKMFLYSIEENGNNSGKCEVINCQPESKSQFSIDLFKHKSSSIPQMKLDELKNSLRQKKTSKDAIEEVNRIFATVRKLDTTDPNRPMIRNGPRVLPVVKIENKFSENDDAATLKCNCQNYKMSSGDSFECCHKNKRNDETFYMCCHYQHCLNVEYCVNCRKAFDQNNIVHNH
ncbi:unnamed protein product, partial [Brenthis ino]